MKRQFSQEEVQHLQRYIKDYKLTNTGRFLYRIIPYCNKLVLQNIEIAFGHALNPVEKTKLSKAVYCHFIKMIKEVIFSLFKYSKVNRRAVTIVGREHFDKAEAKKKGVALLTGHFGNWELTALHLSQAGPEYANKMHVFRKNLGLAWAQKILFKRFEKHGLKIIPFNKHALIRAVKAIKKKQVVLFVLDQFARVERKEGVNVEFFGHKTGTYRSLAGIAQRTKVPVIPSTSYRMPDGRHIIEFLPEVEWQSHDDEEVEIEQNTLAYNQVIEKVIIAHPEQWLWFYDRWKNVKK